MSRRIVGLSATTITPTTIVEHPGSLSQGGSGQQDRVGSGGSAFSGLSVPKVGRITPLSLLNAAGVRVWSR